MVSFKIYQHVEQNHTLLTQVLHAMIIMVVVTLYAIVLMFPISYAIFDYPTPDQWRLLLEIQ